jgi:FkbM family methyltransferase
MNSTWWQGEYIARFKTFVRDNEAHFTPLSRTLRVDEYNLALVRSVFWDESDPLFYNHDIEPYWQVLGKQKFDVIIDAGAATGLFTLSACVKLDTAHIVAFEPSKRQNILLRRNIQRNHFNHRVQIEDFALWNHQEQLTFRTHGAISAVKGVGEHLAGLSFVEKVQAVQLDTWLETSDVKKVDLIKMDIEGAELEAIEGAHQILSTFHPALLIQAYHIRDGERTFERCEQMLKSLNYTCQEAGSGLLYAVAR